MPEEPEEKRWASILPFFFSLLSLFVVVNNVNKSSRPAVNVSNFRPFMRELDVSLF